MPNTLSNAGYEALLDDRAALAKHLEQYDRKLLVAFAFRNALRVLPVLGKNGEFDFWKAEDRTKHIQAVFHALEFSRDVIVDKIDRKGRSRIAAAARAADATYATYATYAADAAAYAAYAYAADAAVVAYAAYAAYDSAAAAAAAAAAVIADLQCLAKQPKAEALLAQPLWSALPEKWSKLEANFQRALVDTLGETDGEQHYQQYKSWAASKFNLPSPSSNTRVALSPAHDDVPSAEDALGRTELVNALAAFCDHPKHQSPSIIALLGDWGAGKSSVIQQLKQRLGLKGELPKGVQLEHEFLYAELNAWEYENTKNMDAALAQEVLKGLLNHYPKGEKKLLCICKRIVLMMRFNWRERKAELFKFLLGGLLSALILFGIHWLLSTTDKIPEDLKAMTVAGGGAMFVAFILWQIWTKGAQFFQHPLSTKLFTFFEQPSYAEHLGYLPSMRQQLHTLLQLRMTVDAPKPPEFDEPATTSVRKNRRLLVVVDDLDRCQPKAINETLDAVRLLLGDNVNNVMVLLAVDYRIALNAVAKRFKKDASKTRSPQQIARDYLAKVVQSSVQLDTPEPQQVKNFVNKNLFENPFAPPVEADTSEPLNVAPDSGDSANAENNASGNSAAASQKTTQSELEQEVIEAQAKKLSSIRDTVDEQQEFNALAAHYAFTNPRQLKRLKNAFQLFRHVYMAKEGLPPEEHQQNDKTVLTADFAEVSQPALHMLFWVEYLHTLPAKQRKGLDESLYVTDRKDDAKPNKEPFKPKMVFWPGKETYASWFKRVEDFVLPAADADYVPDSHTVADDAENESGG